MIPATSPVVLGYPLYFLLFLYPGLLYVVVGFDDCHRLDIYRSSAGRRIVHQAGYLVPVLGLYRGSHTGLPDGDDGLLHVLLVFCGMDLRVQPVFQRFLLCRSLVMPASVLLALSEISSSHVVPP